MQERDWGDNTENTTIVGILQDLGLSENEAKLYMVLLQRGSMTAQDILRNMPLRQPQLYDITSSLERKGFINVLQGRPKKYKAISADVVIEAREQILKKNRDYFLNWANKTADSRREKTALINAKNLRSVVNNSIELVKEASLTLEAETTIELLEYIKEPIKRKARNGVRVELLLFGKSNIPDETIAYFKDLPVEIRYLDPGQFYVLISDEVNSVFMPRSVAIDPETPKYGYIIMDRDMSWFITHNFFVGWYKAKEITSINVNVPCLYKSQRILISDLQRMATKYSRISGTLEGVLRKNGSKFVEAGEIKGINVDTEIINFEFETSSGRYTVGGYDSQIEDVIMKSFRLTHLS
ncbi:hypothetical protein [Thermoplasma volcanium GSS1]|uniref:Transcription regulator TrmB N-terminal domain-containing protein n=1 Tax=Thermoplasma volcanium (strain ATCC 51530 / DSM 4299 / JCM 9571 / NBRC 15438 / GSS1) TaxID=273116 RepID=Q979I7_THEVO|nr:TrmB family transcriptional regulator [Thermoplasma volcanium]BAB60316.1 hypothetical protein [Thermoplasma volcanium GSS1]